MRPSALATLSFLTLVPALPALADQAPDPGALASPSPTPQEMLLEVKAKRNLIQRSSSASATRVDHDQIVTLPQGETAAVPTLIAETTPGVAPGSFGSLLFHGSFGKIQWRIDGVQLPDTPDNSLGEEFSARNINLMSVIVGGFPSEYGDRLSAVVDISTKSGTENPGGVAELNYGSYNAFAPYALYSGSSPSGNWHYFISSQYFRTDRGLDTPEPASQTDIDNGGTDAVHDTANGASGFLKADYQLDNENKFIFIVSESYKFFQIPDYPSSFSITDPVFNQPDRYGNAPYLYTPSTTDDNQTQQNALAVVSWRHALSDHSFFQVAPFYKYTYLLFNNDQANDLYSATGPNAIAGATAGSFYENRHVNNLGVQADYSNRIAGDHLVKAGIRAQASQAAGNFSIVAATTGTAPVVAADDSTNTGYTESAYLQDDYTIAKPLVLNVGVRFDAIQYHFSDAAPTDWLVQPRVGLNYMAADHTKLHAFYGRFFQPAPLEDFRDTFAATQSISQYNCPAGQLCPYDIKSEKDDYGEAGVDQQLGAQLLSLRVFYRASTDELDDTQLLNTNILQPINYANGQNYGLDLSVSGKIGPHWSEYLNYSYAISQVRGISGGIFGIAPGGFPSSAYVPLDEQQLHTANAAVTYSSNRLWWTCQELFGSGLYTGPGNSSKLPSHFATNMTLGYDFSRESWLSKAKVSVDVLNLFNNVYVVSLQNDFNSNHYAPERTFIAHLSKEL